VTAQQREERTVADRHKHRPITFRPSERDRGRLDAYIKRTGTPVRRVLALALAAFLDAAEASTADSENESQQ
jgi:hypothetical protein